MCDFLARLFERSALLGGCGFFQEKCHYEPDHQCDRGQMHDVLDTVVFRDITGNDGCDAATENLTGANDNAGRR